MQQPDVILAGASVRSLAESALRDGLTPVCVDMFGDEDLRWLLNDECGGSDGLRVVRAFIDVEHQLLDIRGDVPIIVGGGLENRENAMEAIRLQRPVLGPSATVTATLRDPRSLFPALNRGGCNVPKFYSSSRPQKAVAHFSVFEDDLQWLQKSMQSAGGQGISFVESATDWAAAPAANSYLQEWIEGIAMSATFCCWNVGECILLGATLQLSGCEELNAPPFQFCGNAGPVSVSSDLQRQLQTIGQCIADEWPIIGIFGVDVVVRRGTALVVEVNPRLTATHELHEHARAGSPGHVAMQMKAFGHLPDSHLKTVHTLPRSSSQKFIARLVVYADRDIMVTQKQHSAMQRLHRSWGGRSVHLWIADVPAVGAEIARGTPFCSVYMDLNKKLDADTTRRKLSAVLPDTLCESLAHVQDKIQANSELLTQH